MKKTLLAIAALTLSAPSFAGFQVGTVKSVTVRDSDGLVFFVLNGTAREGRPTCAGQTYWMIKNETTLAGKQLYAQVLAAQLSGKTLTVEGAGTCTRWPDGEDVRSISLGD
ncbi:hypothetical protein [Massilia sp. CF038]|uniref:hypothetical protein n=1 Tax=Massilia sp. CF038 TaxID=1881045 RepID=UPI00091EC030|nr:hypothetical protein [Massilia sp. CF038]SHG52782.1 hypothetical protein SAMN05428948_0878 [Massilia sp. CF038]